MKKIHLIFFTLLIFCIGFPAYAFELQTGQWLLRLDDQTGKADIYKSDLPLILNSQFAYKTGEDLFFQEQLELVSITQENVTDEFGTGIKVKVLFTSLDEAYAFTQFYAVYNDFILTEFTIQSEEETQTNYMAPIHTATTSNFLPESGNATLFVPFDNDKWVRYRSNIFGESTTSYEVGLVYNKQSNEGLVVGSVEHILWKTGINTTTDVTNGLLSLEVFGGITSYETRDNLPHGTIKGNSIKSPKVFIGYFDDWRDGMELYADVNAIIAPTLEWNSGKPFGWNSWGALQTRLTYTNATEVANYIAENLQNHGFSNDNTVYIGLDSYWDRLSYNNHPRFVTECKARGQKAGIYWSPFVDWGKNPDREIEGASGYYYRDVYLYANGTPQEIADSYAIDPTHPATKMRIDYYLNRFKNHGYEYIKLDFMTHGSLEADSYYDENIYTGIQAYNQGMEYILEVLDNSMYINLSICPLFPSNYGHGRRIACDAYGSINETEYTLNSLTYGWWLDRVYNYNDADNVVLAGHTTNENRARITSSVITGIFIIGDDYSSGGTEGMKSRAQEYLTKTEINNIARNCKAFRPVASGNGETAANRFYTTLADTTYLAVFNYSSSNSKIKMDLVEIGIDGGADQYVVHELWGDDMFIYEDVLEDNIARRDVKLYKIYPGDLTNIEKMESNQGVAVYPNPFKDRVMIDVPAGEYIRRITIHSLEGKEVYVNESVVDEIGLEQLVSGVYFMKVTFESGGSFTSKIIKN